MNNYVELKGNLGMKPEIIETSNGTKLAKVRMATSDVYKNKNGDTVVNTEWHNLVAFGKNADYFEKELDKGDFLHLCGKIINRTYTTKGGDNRQTSEIKVQKLFLEKENKKAA